jgi:hypothetical protein
MYGFQYRWRIDLRPSGGQTEPTPLLGVTKTARNGETYAWLTGDLRRTLADAKWLQMAVPDEDGEIWLLINVADIQSAMVEDLGG